MRMFSTRFATVFLVLAALTLGTAEATPLLKLEFKSLPDQFVQGAELDLPLYLVENRNASEGSIFSGYPIGLPPYNIPGPLPLATVESHITSLQSELLSITPEAAFDSSTNSIFVNPDLHSIFFYFKSTEGLVVTLDNSGIVGRTEIKIATVRVRVGAPIPQDDGIGEPDPAAVFWAELSVNPPPGSRNASIYLGPSGSNNQGQLFLGGIQPSVYRILEAPTQPTPTPTAPPIPSEPGTFTIDQIKKYKQYSGWVYPNFTCNGLTGAICNGSAQLFTTKKVGNKNKKVGFGKCTLPQASAPNPTYCELKLNKTAKALLALPDKKFKATLAVTSTGVSTQSSLKVTIKK